MSAEYLQGKKATKEKCTPYLVGVQEPKMAQVATKTLKTRPRQRAITDQLAKKSQAQDLYEPQNKAKPEDKPKARGEVRPTGVPRRGVQLPRRDCSADGNCYPVLRQPSRGAWTWLHDHTIITRRTSRT